MSDMQELMPRVYDELRRLAAAQLHRERRGHTLQPTALAHEAYLRLVTANDQSFENRAHFLGIAARLMRQILVDHARKRNATKRGGDRERVTMSIAAKVGEEPAFDVLDLDEAIAELAEKDERKARVLELRYFAGLLKTEVAEVLGISPSTVDADWLFARTWLKRRLG